MLYRATNVIGGGDGWASNADGSIQIVTLSATDTEVEFTGVPYVSSYGYELFVDPSYSYVPDTDPPKQIGVPEFTLELGGTYTVTYTITTVTADQAGAKCQLRIVK